jgi:hypothetical protein
MWPLPHHASISQFIDSILQNISLHPHRSQILINCGMDFSCAFRLFLLSASKATDSSDRHRVVRNARRDKRQEIFLDLLVTDEQL